MPSVRVKENEPFDVALREGGDTGVGVVDDGGEIGVAVQSGSVDAAGDLINAVLSGFSTAGQTTHTVGHAIEPRVIIKEKPVLVVSADSAYVGERSGAEQKHEIT